MSHLTFTETKNLTFRHNNEGVNAFLNKKKTILNHINILKEGVKLTLEQQNAFIKIILSGQSMIRNLPYHNFDNFSPVVIPKQENDFTPFYKYTSPDVYNKYIKKGNWQLGCIQQYKTIENLKARDEFEGQTFIDLNINSHQVTAFACCGFNYLILCGTSERSESLHQDSFGSKELYFPNVRSVAESICRSIGAKRFFAQKVSYNSSKWFTLDSEINNDKIDLEDIVSEPYIELINKLCLYPSLFVKPAPFENEKEVRIVFEMERDQKMPRQFFNKEILNYIKH
jgi:hypothetical protein